MNNCFRVLIIILTLLICVSKEMKGSVDKVSRLSINNELGVNSDTSLLRFQVSGNQICKVQIEEICKSVLGVISASWDPTTNIVEIKVVSAIFISNDIHFSLASKGYDTEELRAKDAIYDQLPAECKYTRKTVE